MRPVKRDMDDGILAALRDCNPVEVTTSESIEVQVIPDRLLYIELYSFACSRQFCASELERERKEAEKLWGELRHVIEAAANQRAMMQQAALESRPSSLVVPLRIIFTITINTQNGILKQHSNAFALLVYRLQEHDPRRTHDLRRLSNLVTGIAHPP